MADEDAAKPLIELAAVNLTRREIMGMGAVAAAGALGVAAPIARYLRPGGAGGGTGSAEIASEELRMWDALPLIVAQRPASVVRTPTEVFAVGSRCTHLSCVVKWQKSRRIFFCPCHGARFAPDGSLLGGPAPGPLPAMKVSESEGRVRVELA
jgi:nitrite reductase/ring-hydroxylating ferredoxin subunit